MTPTDEPLLEVYEALADEVDLEFAAIHRRQATQMVCRAGCSACCRARLSVTRIEEASIRRGLAQLPEAERRQLARRARREGREFCPALDDEGHCQIYSIRPLICRSFGVALRHRSVEPLVHPAKIDACDKNFQGTSLKTLPPEDVFDQARLNERLDRLDAEYRQPHHLPDGERVPLAQIIADAMTLDE